MLPLTRQQQKVVAGVLLLLLMGWGVKAWRLAHPRSAADPDPPKTHAETDVRGPR